MRYALDRAADYLRADLTKYKIEVPEAKRTIVRRMLVIQVDPYTPYRQCLTILRAEIRKEKEIEAYKNQQNQGRLL